MNKTTHSRTLTEYHQNHNIKGSIRRIRVKTTLAQVDQKNNLITRRHIYSQSCFQQAHLLTFSSSKQRKIDKNALLKDEIQDYSLIYILERIIAKGRGVVYKAHSKTQHHLAIKKVQVKEGGKNSQLAVLRNLDNPSILKIIDYYFTGDNNTQYLNLVSQYYSHSLKKIIDLKITRPSLLPLYLYQILNGLAYLKQKQIIHQNLTPSNILLQMSTNKVAISGFGSAKTSSTQSLQSVVARAYRAPELVFGSINYSQQVDLWAFGCIAYELITGRTLFQSQSSVEHMLKLLKMLGTPTLEQMREMNPYFSMREYQSLPKIRKRSFKDAIGLKNISLVDLLSKIFVYTPTKRLSATQALKHPYFNCLKQKQYYEQNNFYPEQLKIQFKQLSNEKEQVFRSSIKLQSNHKSLISTASKLSESTLGQSKILKSKGIVSQKADGLAHRLFI